MSILRPGETCWRMEPADRVAFLVDTQDYFNAVSAALAKARHSILLLGWGFDPRTRLQPDGFEGPDDPDEIGHVLIRLSKARPDLDIRLLIWKSALPVAISQEFFPHRSRAWFKGTSVKFVLDDAVPLAACHHQKVLVIDDAIAFCGGGDFGVDRWDTLAHSDSDTRRLMPDHDQHAPRHEVVMMVDGAAARSLGDLARERWRRGTGETLTPPQPSTDEDIWPARVRPNIEKAEVAIVRTQPSWHGSEQIEEWRALTLRSIEEARHTLYLENQYFTSPVIAEALAKRLAEPDGPQIVLVSTAHSPSYFDKLTMDRTRSLMLRRLRAADVFGRFTALSPFTTSGHPVIVHAKVTIVDDRLVRIGSANMNNRSGGLDTECEVAVEAGDDAARQAITTLRNHLVGHYVSRTTTDVAIAIERHGGLIGAIDALNHGGRLRPIELVKLGPLARFIAEYHLGDPTGPADDFAPLKRRRNLHDQVRAIAAGEGLPSPLEGEGGPLFCPDREVTDQPG
jgi:phosphatidylserine/phosphatidylglycerophosphate/cardiolipin synthase-like enzyme